MAQPDQSLIFPQYFFEPDLQNIPEEYQQKFSYFKFYNKSLIEDLNQLIKYHNHPPVDKASKQNHEAQRKKAGDDFYYYQLYYTDVIVPLKGYYENITSDICTNLGIVSNDSEAETFIVDVTNILLKIENDYQLYKDIMQKMSIPLYSETKDTNQSLVTIMKQLHDLDELYSTDNS